MKVFVTTKNKAYKDEIYVRVSKTLKAAEKSLRAEYPNIRKIVSEGPLIHRYESDENKMWILTIREEEI